MLLDQQVLALDLLACGVFLRWVVVLDDLEHIGEGGQVEHQHHHALDARGDAELVGAVAQVLQEVSIKQGLALLVQAKRRVDFRTRLVGHEAAQELHIGRRDLHVDQEIGARKAEECGHVVMAEECRVDAQLSLRIVQDGQGKGQFAVAVDDLAHHIGALVAKEQAGQHLDLKVRPFAELAHLGQGGAVDQAQVPLQVGKGALQAEGAHHLAPGVDHGASLARVIGTKGGLRLGLAVLDVLGGHRRTHEDEVVVEVAAVQHLRGHGIEEGLRQLGLVVVDQQSNDVQLDLLPHIHGQVAGLELGLQPLAGLPHPQVIKLDALALRRLLPVPVGLLEAALRVAAGLPEQGVVPVEAFDQRLRNPKRAAVGQGMGEQRLAGAFRHRQASSRGSV